jgi:hypothetical protein
MGTNSIPSPAASPWIAQLFHQLTPRENPCPGATFAAIPRLQVPAEVEPPPPPDPPTALVVAIWFELLLVVWLAPPLSDDAPPLSDDAPPLSDDAPPLSDDVPPVPPIEPLF